VNGIDRLWSIGAALVAGGVVAGVWFGVISPDLTATSRARDDLSAVEQQNALHEVRIAALEEEAARMPTLAAAREQLAAGIPSELDYTDFMRQVDAYAVEAGVMVTGFSSVDAVPYLPPIDDAAAQPAPEPAEGEEQEGASADDAAAAPVAAPGEPAPAPMPYTDLLVGEHNFAAAQFTIVATGDRAALADFLHRLQMGPRIVSIATAAFEPDDEDPTLQQVEITGSLYVLEAGAAATP
jgi:hypothetical protein